MNNKNNLWLTVIAGGNGTRLFLFSNKDRPKQFCRMNEDNTFIQATVERFLQFGIDPKHVIIIVANEVQQDLAITQLSERFNILSSNILNIGPDHGYAGAKIYATKVIEEKDPNAKIIMTPADQYVENNQDFKNAILRGLAIAETNPVVIGKRINDANAAKELGNIIYDNEENKAEANGFSIETFVEKPDIDWITKTMLEKSSACNTGISIWKPSQIIKDNDIDIGTDKLINELLIEPKLVVGKFPWEDCGTFEALYRLNSQYTGADVVTLSDKENIVPRDCSRCLIISSNSIELNVNGIKDAAVIATMIDGEYYLEIASFNATKSVATAAKIFEEDPDMFKQGITLGGKNNGFTNPYGDKFHVCFIGVSGCKVDPYLRKKGTPCFLVSCGF